MRSAFFKGKIYVNCVLCTIYLLVHYYYYLFNFCRHTNKHTQESYESYFLIFVFYKIKNYYI